jgi:hypothetical protein
MAAKGVWSGDSVADHESASTTLHRVAGFDRNGWPASVGISGRLASESVAGFRRNTQTAYLVFSERRFRAFWSGFAVSATGDAMTPLTQTVSGCALHIPFAIS